MWYFCIWGVSKNTYYRFLNETSYNWSKFLLLLAAKVATVFDTLTRPKRVKVLILDDNESNRYNEISNQIDHGTNGYKFRKESMMHKTDVAVLLVKNALNAGIKADYVLMDTWFTTEPMIKEILSTGIDAILLNRCYLKPHLFRLYSEIFAGKVEFLILYIF